MNFLLPFPSPLRPACPALGLLMLRDRAGKQGRGCGNDIMKQEDKELEEAKELFKEGLKKIFQATQKVVEKVVEGFREGYAIDVTEKEK
jgi:hypothetical protein